MLLPPSGFNTVCWQNYFIICLITQCLMCTMASGCHCFYSLTFVAFYFRSLFSSYWKCSNSGLPELCLWAICVLWYCNYSTSFVDGWHKYSRETYVRINIHDLFDCTNPASAALGAAKSPRKLNERLELRNVGASPLSTRRHRPSSEACGVQGWPI